MNKTLAGFFEGLIFAVVAALPAFAQGNSFTVNSDRSVAAVSVGNTADENSNFQMGTARVIGNAILDAKEPSNSSFNFTIFPSGTELTPVNPDGTWANGRLPNVAAYTVLTFKSNRAELLSGGKMRLTGDLTVTQFVRAITLTYSEDYDGPKYGTSVIDSTTRQASFIFDLNAPASTTSQEANAKVITASSALSGEDFPGLLDAVLNTNWPVLVQNEDTDPPAMVGEDYSGAAVSGNYVPKQARPSHSLPTIGEDYSGSDAFNGPAPNQVIIQAQLGLNPGPSGHPQSAGN